MRAGSNLGVSGADGSMRVADYQQRYAAMVRQDQSAGSKELRRANDESMPLVRWTEVLDL